MLQCHVELSFDELSQTCVCVIWIARFKIISILRSHIGRHTLRINTDGQIFESRFLEELKIFFKILETEISTLAQKPESGRISENTH